MAQGVDRVTIARVVDYTPEYISWLARQRVCKEYLAHLIEAADVQIKAQYCMAVDVIGDMMANGTEDAKLKAAKINLEANGKIGKGHGTAPDAPDSDQLEVLANRLVKLLHNKRDERVVDGEVIQSEVSSA